MYMYNVCIHILFYYIYYIHIWHKINIFGKLDCIKVCNMDFLICDSFGLMMIMLEKLVKQFLVESMELLTLYRNTKKNVIRTEEFNTSNLI